MKQILNSLAFIGAIALCGCSSTNTQVTTNHDPAATFGGYHTYALKAPQGGPALSQSADAALRKSLRENMATRGIREVSANDRADLAVIPRASTQERIEILSYNSWATTGGMYSYRYSRLGLWPATAEERYTEKILSLDFVDTSSQKVVLTGEANGDLISREKNTANIDGAVKKIVAEIPAGTPQYVAQ